MKLIRTCMWFFLSELFRFSSRKTACTTGQNSTEWFVHQQRRLKIQSDKGGLREWSSCVVILAENKLKLVYMDQLHTWVVLSVVPLLSICCHIFRDELTTPLPVSALSQVSTYVKPFAPSWKIKGWKWGHGCPFCVFILPCNQNPQQQECLAKSSDTQKREDERSM